MCGLAVMVSMATLPSIPSSADEPAALGPDGTRARALNDQGLALQRRGKVDEGLEAFREAVEADPSYAMAHYNLACALARMRAAGRTCQADAYRSTIIEHLERSVVLDARRRARARLDADLDPVRDTIGFQRIILRRSLNMDDDVRAVLVAVTWYGPSPGAYGPEGGLRFLADGTFTGWQLVFDDEGRPERRSRQGRFSVKGGRIEMRFEGRPEALSATLTWSSLDVEELGRFTDDPDDCSA